MKKASQLIVIIIAITATIIMAMQLVEFLHMVFGMTHFEQEGTRMSLVFDSEGFTPWFPFIKEVESWWAWITKMLSVIILILFVKKEKKKKDTPTE